MAAKLFLVTGTDTGVGKTFVSAALTYALNRAGTSTIAVKPAETGCGKELNPTEDGSILWEASGRRGWHGALYRFPEPLAPAVAADRVHANIDINRITAEIRGLQSTCQVLLIEGAGGLLVPLTWEMSYLDLAAHLSAQVLIVARAGLGTINHTLLTYRSISMAGLSVAGIVMNRATADISESTDPSISTNSQAISRLTGYNRIVSLPFSEQKEALACSLQQVVEWLRVDAD